MKTQECRARVREVLRASVLDPARAKAMEEELYFDLLNAIAQGKCESPLECSRAVVETKRVTTYRSRK